MVFNRVEGVGRRLPGGRDADVRQKIALFPDTQECQETIDLIEKESDHIIDATEQRLKQFIYPWDITPHLTFAIFRGQADDDQVKSVMDGYNELLRKQPLVVSLGSLTFRHASVRSKKRK